MTMTGLNGFTPQGAKAQGTKGDSVWDTVGYDGEYSGDGRDHGNVNSVESKGDDGEGDGQVKYEVDELVRVVKTASHDQGGAAKVTDPNCNGMVNVVMTSGLETGMAKSYLPTDLERMSDYNPGTTFISPLTNRAKDRAEAKRKAANASVRADDFYDTPEYQHEAKRLLRSVKPLVTELAINADNTTVSRIELADVETTIGRILAMYLSFVARSAPDGSDCMSKSLERILHQGGLEMTEAQNAIQLVNKVLDKRRSQRLDLQNHIVITFPGSHDHMLQIVKHFIRYFTEHEPRPVVILHDDEVAFNNLKEGLQTELKEATAKLLYEKAKFIAKKKRALNLKEQTIRLETELAAMELKERAQSAAVEDLEEDSVALKLGIKRPWTS
mmetsp:Transcript_44694/g.121811  ORF Transcript_44694/g.121811 Transcript_44694/m.121811 type:complete len:385 (-) Transcript_44694:2539-3693(-)